MREALLAGVLLVAVLMILTAILVAARALLAPAVGKEQPEPPPSDEAGVQTHHRCKVRSSRTVAPLLREIVLSLPEGEALDLSSGMHVEVTAPPHALAYSDYSVAAEHRPAWDRMGLWGLSSASKRPARRAFWIANTIEDGRDWVVLLVQLALPPPDRPELRPGIVSSWLFGLRPGDEVELSGPYGSPARCSSEAELVFIGAGQGMAPIRAILSSLLSVSAAKPERRISLWYDARKQGNIPYRDELDQLAAAHPGFTWTCASAEGPEDGGFVHEILYRDHLAAHPAPEACEYHVYGPPMMTCATLAMLDDLGVETRRISVNGMRADEMAELPAGEDPATLLRDFMITDLLLLRPEMQAVHALRLLLERDLSGAPVVSGEGVLVGVLSRQDCLRAAVLAPWFREWDRPVSDLMRRDFQSLDANLELTRVAAHFGPACNCFPVVDDGRLVGLVSLTELQRALLGQWR